MTKSVSKFKKTGNAGIKGTTFQINVLMFCLFKAINDKLKDWRLSSENEDAGKFDDVVLEHEDGAFLIQTKYRQKGKITFDELMSTNSNRDDFSLVKYFLSYMKIKSKFRITNVIICTNAAVTLDEDKQKLLKSQNTTSDSILYCPERNCSFYKFDKKIVPLLKARLKEHFETSKNKGDGGEDIFTDEDIEDFLQHLQFYYDFPCGKDLKNVMNYFLTRLNLSNRIFNKISLQDIWNTIYDWYEQPPGSYEYITEAGARAMFSEILSNKYCEKLNWCNVLFKKIDLDFEGRKRIFHITLENVYILKVIKILQALREKKKKVLFINPEDEATTQRQKMEAFDRPCYEFLIIVWPKVPPRDILMEICTKLKETLERYAYKKVIFLAKNDDMLNRHLDFADNIHKMDMTVEFNDLSKESQERLLNKKKIVYQTKKMNLAELYGKEAYDCAPIRLHILEKIVMDEEIFLMPYVHVQNFDGAKKKDSESSDEQNGDSNHDDFGSLVSVRFLAERMVHPFKKRNMIEFPMERDEDVNDVNIGQEFQGKVKKKDDFSIVRMLLERGTLVSIGNESGTKTYYNYMTSR